MYYKDLIDQEGDLILDCTVDYDADSVCAAIKEWLNSKEKEKAKRFLLD